MVNWDFTFFDLVSFLGNLKTPKGHFEIDWHHWLRSQFNVQSKSCEHKGAGKQNTPSKRIPTQYVPVVWHLQKYAECLLCKYGRSSIFFAMIFSDSVCPAEKRYKYTSDRISRFLVQSFFCLLYFLLSSLCNYSCLLYVLGAD